MAFLDAYKGVVYSLLYNLVDRGLVARILREVDPTKLDPLEHLSELQGLRTNDESRRMLFIEFLLFVPHSSPVSG